MSDLFSRTPVVLTGEFGSGKTELALSLALKARSRRDGDVVLVDMDVVTPFFRSRDVSEELEDRGVQVLYPSSFPKGVDLPILPPAAVEAIDLADFAVLDVGGGRMGSRVLGGLAASISNRGGRVLAVLNSYRPMSSTPERIRDGLKRLSRDLRLPIDGIVANPNLGTATRVEDVETGMEIIRLGACAVDLPIVAVGIGEHLMIEDDHPRWARELAGDAVLLVAGRRLRPGWE
ncbi:MAG: hypothetical protein ACLFS8_02140 [Clostridia bacterium]